MKKQNIVIAAVVSVLVLLIAGSGGYLLFRHLNVQQSDERMESAKSEAQSAAEKGTPSSVTPTDSSGEPLEPNPVNFGYWQGINPEIYSWINVPGTEVGTSFIPVIRRSDLLSVCNLPEDDDGGFDFYREVQRSIGLGNDGEAEPEKRTVCF